MVQTVASQIRQNAVWLTILGTIIAGAMGYQHLQDEVTANTEARTVGGRYTLQDHIRDVGIQSSIDASQNNRLTIIEQKIAKENPK